MHWTGHCPKMSWTFVIVEINLEEKLFFPGSHEAAFQCFLMFADDFWLLDILVCCRDVAFLICDPLGLSSSLSSSCWTIWGRTFISEWRSHTRAENIPTKWLMGDRMFLTVQNLRQSLLLFMCVRTWGGNCVYGRQVEKEKPWQGEEVAHVALLPFSSDSLFGRHITFGWGWKAKPGI